MTQHCYNFPRPGVTADSVIVCNVDGVMKILLIKRKINPYKDHWAIPGGFMNPDETTEQAAHRELHEETGLTDVTLHRVDIFDTVNRDPRGRTITVAYTGIVSPEQAATVKAGDDAQEIAWYALDTLPDLAFDHAEIVAAARIKMGNIK
jgi:8-oxo-dGTP diphosphatase